MEKRGKLLAPFVRAVALEIIERKEANNVQPACATRLEVLRDIREAVKEAMRELHKSGEFTGFDTIHDIAIRRR